MKKLKPKLIINLLIILSSEFLIALNDAPQTFTVDGYLYQTGTNNLLTDSNVNIKIQILDPSKNCILYEEQQIVDTNTSKGYFNINIGSNIGDVKRTANDANNTMAKIFQNLSVIAAVNAPSKICVGTVYSPSSGDVRYFRIIIIPSATGVADTLSPDMVMDSVPNAITAQSVQGLEKANIVQFDASGIVNVNAGGINIAGGTGVPIPAGFSGIYSSAPNRIDIARNGVMLASFLPSGYTAFVGPVVSNTYLDFVTNKNGFSMDANGTYINTQNLTRFKIDNAGNVGIGTTGSVTTKLQVAGVISPDVDSTRDLGTSSLKFKDIYASNNIIQTSDERLKANIEISDLGLEFVNRLRPVSYYWKKGDKDLHYGVIAQETRKVLLELKKVNKNEINNGIVVYDKKFDQYGVRYTELISPIIKSIQELYLNFEKEKSSRDLEIKKLKQENELIKARLDKIEKALNKE